jgi:hypothetical protein
VRRVFLKIVFTEGCKANEAIGVGPHQISQRVPLLPLTATGRRLVAICSTQRFRAFVPADLIFPSNLRHTTEFLQARIDDLLNASRRLERKRLKGT